MPTVDMSSATYSAEQIALLFEELHEKEADNQRLYEENRCLIERLEVKDLLIQSTEDENRKLREYKASVRAIAAIPHAVAGPYSKLAMITYPDQVSYSAGKHGGDESVQLTSMKRWNMAIGGNEENTHCLARALEPLEATGTITRTEIKCPDKRKHFAVAVNEEHFRNPKLIKPTEERPNNGGNKRCPQCGEFCRKRVTVTYECEKCGIEFDGAMNPLGTPVKDVAEIPTPEPEKITVSQPELKPEPVDSTPDHPALTEDMIAAAFGKGNMKGVWND